jgi:lipoic acid synthetase
MKSQEMPTAATMLRKPPWLKVRLPHAEKTLAVTRRLSSCRLHTVCQEARCPNLGECFQAGTATFLILGDCCTRNCRYCNVRHGIPEAPDEEEAERLASAVARLGLTYVVMTSVTRDDLPDGGAGRFVRCIERIRESCPGCRVEVLIPDFGGSPAALRAVVEAAPDVISHNMEICRKLFPTVRPQGNYESSLELLRRVHNWNPAIGTKSGFMIGLGEEQDDILMLLDDLHHTGCERLTIGQYLQPTRNHWPVYKYYSPEEFEELRKVALEMGFKAVMAGPLVRSSYHAAEMK